MWTQERNGKFRFFERYVDPLTGKTKSVSCTLDKNNAAARKKASAILQHKIDEQIQNAAQPQSIRLQTLIDKYGAFQYSTIKESSAERNEYEGKAVAKILGPDSLVERLTVAYVMDHLLSAGETVTCTNSRIKYIRSLIRWGYRFDLVSSPALADKLEYLPDPRKKEKLQMKYMEPDELNSVLDAMKIKHWKLLTEFLCLSGLRIGELVALRDEDVGDKYIHVNKTYDLRVNKLYDTPKTESSNRDVFIQPELAECIRNIRIERKKFLIKSGRRTKLFFPAADGKYLHYDAYRKYLVETTERVIGRKLTPHACRHTMTSIFAAQDASLEAIGRRLGHNKGSDVTREIYLHVTGEQRKKDEAVFNNIRILRGS